MTDTMKVGLSGLLVAQRQLTTTSHNVSNVNTRGYSRQVSDQLTREPQFLGNGFVGQGVEIQNTERISDEFANLRLRDAVTENGRLQAFTEFSSQLDELLAGEDGGIDSSLQNFFDSIEAASSDAFSVPARQVMLNEAENMVSRFQFVDSRIDGIDASLRSRVRGYVDDINTYAQQIADLNRDIARVSIPGAGPQPNDLLDQRDQVVRDLAEVVAVSTVPQEDGALNIFIGSGQALVIGESAASLAVSQDTENPNHLDVTYDLNNVSVSVGRSINGGRLGGLFDVQREMVDVARNELGRLATAIGTTLNDQHRLGVDLNGDLGGDLFSVGSGAVVASASNTGSSGGSIVIDDVSDLRAADYTLRYDGAQYSMQRNTDGTSITGAGPSLSMDGFTVTMAAGANAGDRFLVQPLANAVGDLDVTLTQLNKLAIGAPVSATAPLTNNSGTGLGDLEVLDASNPNLRDPIELRFNESPATFDVVDVNSSTTLSAGNAYSAGDSFALNGWQVQLPATYVAGDSFVIAPSSNAIGDNRNALKMGALREANIIEGRASYQQGYATMVGRIGSISRQANSASEVQQRLTDDAFASREAISGVNLDEEAVNLLRYQQAYQAAAQVIQVGKDLFDTIIGISRG